MINKVRILKEFCGDHNCGGNESKTKFFVDVEPLLVDWLVIASCTSYIYLRSPFTSDGSVLFALNVHA